MSRLLTILISAITAIVLTTGVVLVDQGRALELSVPSSSNSTASTYTPTPFTNTTLLNQTCVDICKGGTCQQSLVSGTTTCSTCPTGFTLDPLSYQCMDGRQCALWPWCTHYEALNLMVYHSTVQAVGATSNYTQILSSTPTVTQLVNLVPGATYAEMVINANIYFAAKAQRLAVNDTSDVTRYWDDELVSSDSLDIYRITLLADYTPYVTGMKRLACATTWLARDGTCVAPI